MADKLLALVGPGRGPRLCTKRMGQLRIRYTGLKTGVARIHHEGGQEESTQAGVCEFSIPPSEWVIVEYEGKDRSFLATVHSDR